jgi:hypothetical protein
MWVRRFNSSLRYHSMFVKRRRFVCALGNRQKASVSSMLAFTPAAQLYWPSVNRTLGLAV